MSFVESLEALTEKLEAKATRIYLLYASADKPFGRFLLNELRSRGYDVNKGGFQAGVSISSFSHKVGEQNDVFIVVLSDALDASVQTKKLGLNLKRYVDRHPKKY